MTYRTTFKTTQVPHTQCTCASPALKFNDFNEPKGRGWCNVFDKVAYQHHVLTVDCQLNLPPETDTEAYNEEDLPYCKYQEGNIVKIIDSTHKDHSQWETFVVVGQKAYTFNDCFKTIKAYPNLSQPEWYHPPGNSYYWKAYSLDMYWIA